MKNNIKVYASIALLALINLSTVVMAQPGPGNGGDPGGGPPVGGNAPIGGGAGILVAFGIAYAISRYNMNKKEK